VRKASLVYALLLMGFTAIVAQVVLIRELLTSFSGNELSIGIFFANWLLLEALGSYAAGRRGDRVESGIPHYASLQLVISLALPAIIFLTRIARNFPGTIPGQGIDVFTVFYLSLFLLTPLGLADGAQFSFGCRIFAEEAQKGASSTGKVYVYEAIGSLLGGIAGTYVCIQHLNALQTAFYLAALNFVSAIWLLSLGRSRYGSLQMAAAVLLVVCMGAFPLGGIEYLHQKSIEIQWRGYEVREYRNSAYGNVALLKRGEQLNLMANGVPVATIPTPDIAFVEEFVHLSLLAHDRPRFVLLIGHGAGGILREILKHPVERVDYAELDPLLIRTAQEHAPALIASELSDPRVAVHYVDGRYFVRTTRGKYDVILVNLPDPSTLEINRFYTHEFYRTIRERLRRKGLLCFALPGSAAYLSEELIDLNASLMRTVEKVFPHLRVVPGDYNLVLASTDRDLKETGPDTLIQRMFARSLQTRLLSDFHVRYKLDEMRLKWFTRELGSAGRTAPNRDFHPVALFYDLVFWNSVHSPGFARVFEPLESFRLGYVVAAIAVCFTVLFLLQRRRLPHGKLSVAVPTAATGFAGMGADVVLVLAFQSFYGYVYHWIGLLIAAFMVGLALGGAWMTGRLAKAIDGFSSFLRLEILLFLYAGLLLGALFLLNLFQENPFVFSSVRVVLLFLNALCGFLVGAEFPLANRIYLEQNPQHAQAAGVLYAADLTGAWVGSLVVAVGFIPLFGTVNTCLLILVVKLCSLLYFFFSVFLPFSAAHLTGRGKGLLIRG